MTGTDNQLFQPLGERAQFFILSAARIEKLRRLIQPLTIDMSLMTDNQVRKYDRRK